MSLICTAVSPTCPRRAPWAERACLISHYRLATRSALTKTRSQHTECSRRFSALTVPCDVDRTESLWQVRDVAQRRDRRIANEGVVCYVRSESAGWKAFISVDVRHTKKSTVKFTSAASNLSPSLSNEQQKATLIISRYKCRAVY
jgi:hypothetical protein